MNSFSPKVAKCQMSQESQDQDSRIIKFEVSEVRHHVPRVHPPRPDFRHGEWEIPGSHFSVKADILLADVTAKNEVRPNDLSVRVFFRENEDGENEVVTFLPSNVQKRLDTGEHLEWMYQFPTFPFDRSGEYVFRLYIDGKFAAKRVTRLIFANEN